MIDASDKYTAIVITNAPQSKDNGVYIRPRWKTLEVFDANSKVIGTFDLPIPTETTLTANGTPFTDIQLESILKIVREEIAEAMKQLLNEHTQKVTVEMYPSEDCFEIPIDNNGIPPR